MKKPSFLTMAIIAISAATMSISVLGMDNTLITTETPTFTFKLSLREVTLKDIKNSLNRSFDEDDKHACNVLGIPWEDNNNIYWTDRAIYKNSGDTTDSCWKYIHPKGLPLPTKLNHCNETGLQHTLYAPSSFPAGFVKKLQETGSITLENSKFETPVKIIFELASITKLPGTNKYMLGGFVLSIAGFIAYLIYLHQNNQLDDQLSRVTDFIRSLTTNKI